MHALDNITAMIMFGLLFTVPNLTVEALVPCKPKKQKQTNKKTKQHPLPLLTTKVGLIFTW